MDEVVVVGDIHEGMSFDRKIDADTGISARAMDIHNAFATTARYAVDHGAKVFTVVGDMFDRSHVSPGFRELVRKDIIEPLGKAKIPVWILAGNHDQPHSFHRSTSLDDYRGYSHVEVFKKPAVRTIKLGNNKAGFVILPYLHPEQVVRLVEDKIGREIPRQQWNEAAQSVMKGLVSDYCTGLREDGADTVAILGHYYITGSQLGKYSGSRMLPDEFQFSKAMFPEDIDIGVFGHIHIHQQVMQHPRVLYTGSVERVDWGEWDEDKGFVVLEYDGADGKIKAGNPKINWKFVATPARRMLRLQIKIEAGEKGSTQKILAAIPEDIAGAMLRIELKTAEAVRKSIDERALQEKLQETFDYEIVYSEEEGEKSGVTGFTSDPFELAREYIGINYSKDPRRDNLQKAAVRILEEAVK